MKEGTIIIIIMGLLLVYSFLNRYDLVASAKGVHVYRINHITGTVSFCKGFSGCVQIKEKAAN